jgi:acyl-CoA-binding protein
LIEIFRLTAELLSLSKYPTSDEIKLQVYGLYKQATFGDCNTQCPPLYDFIGKSKWAAWNNLKGMSKINAMKNYVGISVKADPTIQKKMESLINDEDYVEDKTIVIPKESAMMENIGLKMVDQKDYSSSYSHPYFKSIEKGE